MESANVASVKKRRVKGLDGLRTIGAIAVLAYHLSPFAPGGFLGVDVFFVLSGFLITALLVKEHHRSGRINLWSFWLRRIRRLLPASALMAVVTLIVAGTLSMDLLAGILPQFLGVITFSYNWVEIARGASYFDQANPHLWTNVWSLAVEQQFYLLWPAIVLLVILLRRGVRWVVPTVLGALSAGWMAYLISNADDFTRAYQGSDSHAFSLMVGAALALATANPLGVGRRRYPLVRGVGAWLGLIGIVLCCLHIPDSQTWVYPWGTLLACVCSALVIQGVLGPIDERYPAKLLVGLLEWKPIKWFGVRSYGVYLWHWPVWVILSHELPHVDTRIIGCVVVVLSVVAAALSFRFVEEPMRRDGIGHTLRRWLGSSWAFMRPSRGYKPAAVDYVKFVTPLVAVIAVVGAVVGFLIGAPEKTSAELAVQKGQQAVHGDESHGGKQGNEPQENGKPGAGKDGNEPGAGNSDGNKGESADGESKKPRGSGHAPQVVGKNVTVIGDSVTLAAAPALQQALPDVSVDAEVSRAMPAGISLVQSLKSEGALRPYVVLSLATNSAVSAEQLDQLYELIGKGHYLVLVTAFGPERTTWIGPSNDVMRSWAAGKDRVQVADWAAAIGAHTENLAGDYVHPDGQGGKYYAEVVKKALTSFK